jgi:glycine betaine/choline ABC-type transport system substrate-binding protein
MEDEVDFVVGSATDGLIEKFELAVLEDDRSYFPPYDAAAVYRPSTAERVPALAEVLGLLEGNLDEAAMRALNRESTMRRAAAEVARLSGGAGMAFTE